MIRRVVVTVAAIALVLGIGMVTAASPAGASVPTIIANGSATCTNLGGVVHFTPPLFAAGTSNTESASFTVNLNSLSSGCSTTATNLPAGGILYGKVTATLTTTTTDNSANSCASLGTSHPLSMTIAWHYKNSSGMTLAKLPSTTVSFSGLDSPTNSASEPGYALSRSRRYVAVQWVLRRSVLGRQRLWCQDHQFHRYEVRSLDGPHVAQTGWGGHNCRSVTGPHWWSAAHGDLQLQRDQRDGW